MAASVVLPLTAAHAEHRGAHDALALLVGGIDGPDEPALPRPQLEQGAGERARTYGQRFDEGHDLGGTGKPGFPMDAGPRKAATGPQRRA